VVVVSGGMGGVESPSSNHDETRRLFESKLIVPARRPGTVTRAGLVNRLRAARAASLVVVTAPAGYGKTTLVADWSRRDGRRFVWYAVDEADHPAAFVEHLVEAVSRACDPDVTAHVREGQSRAAEVEPDDVAAQLGRLLDAAAMPVVVVLDDVDLLQDPQSIRILERFAEDVPAGSQLALVSRDEPPLRLARLRSQGRLLELGVSDLRLSDREAAALLHGAGAHASVEEASTLNKAVEGWAAGVYLAALSLRTSSAEMPRTGIDMMFDFFRDELLANVDDHELLVLTRTSILDRLTGSLCDVVADTTGTAELLERLERSNLFVRPLDREREWYAVHGVFRKVLYGELERREPGLVPLLYRRAAAWCADHGDPETALDYAWAAGDPEQVAALVERSSLPFTARPERAAVARALETIDDDAMLERHPAAAAIGALTWAMTGRGDAAERWAKVVERRRVSPRARSSMKKTVSPWPSLLHALFAPVGAHDMRAEAERALQSLPLGSLWRAPVLLALGAANALSGDFQAAETALRDAAEVAESAGAAAVESAAVAYQSLLATDRGDWARADALADTARRLVDDAKLDNNVTTLFALAAGARSALRRGQWATVHDDLERAGVLLPRLTYAIGSFSVLLRLEFARVHLALGDLPRAAALLDEVDAIFAHRPRLGVFREQTFALRAQLEADLERAHGRNAALTAAELRLVPLLATHLSFREIADRLYVSRNTVKTQAISVYRKLGVSSRREAVARAAEFGLVPEDVEIEAM
jgi:LuxR family transcriptional regulator, maltose regulon positive regulatory protein